MIEPKLTQRMIANRDVTLSLWSTPKTGKPLLYCLHGGPGLDSSSLLPGILGLSKYFDLALLDLRGCGQSGCAEDGEYSLKAYADDLIAVVNETRIAGTIGVLGHSFGGSVAIEALAKADCPFDFGILCAAPFDQGWEAYAGQAVSASTNPDVIASGRMELTGELEVDNDFRTLTIGYRALYFPELRSEQSEALMSRWNYRIKPYRYALQNVFPKLGELSEKCAQISVPTLAISGSIDPIIPAEYFSGIQKVLPSITLRFMEGTGHFPFLTASHEFLNQVSQWWEFNAITERIKS